MHKLIFVLATFVCRAASPAALPAGPAPPTLPGLVVQANRGAAIRLTDWKGHVVIVTFWATWCPACRAEMDGIRQIAAEFAGQVKVLAVAIDGTGWRTVTPFLRQHDIRVPVALADRQLLRAFHLSEVPATVPRTFVFGRSGGLAFQSSTALAAGELRRIAGALAGSPHKGVE